MPNARPYIRWFEELGSDDVASVGGKNASLGEMIDRLSASGIRVPGGFATTATAYRDHLAQRGLADRIAERLDRMHADDASLEETGSAIRSMITRASLPDRLEQDLAEAYDELSRRIGRDDPDVAVRSSATAEDLPEASFAGQQETFLNITGVDDLVKAVRRCFASLYTDRAIAYRERQGFEHGKVALSVGVQRMVRSDRGGAGVMFSIDTETGFPDVVLIDAAFGLGESVVSGAVDPDEYVVFKPLLQDESLVPIIGKRLGVKERKVVYASGRKPTTSERTSAEERARFVLEDPQILELARWAALIEQHYDTPMDIEWALDGESGELFIVQARPETVQARREARSLRSFRIREHGSPILEGLAIGSAIAAGGACVLQSADEIDRFEPGSVLVTGMTDPDWVPIMKRAAAIVTDHGGRTSHAAIVSRELGVPAIVGSGDATERLEDGRTITVSCAEGETGFVYEGEVDYEEQEIDLDEVPRTDTEVMLNLANPDAAMRWWRLPADGVGLARMEFVVGNEIRIHPMALVHPEQVEDDADRSRIERITRGYPDGPSFFVETLARGIGRIAASRHPHPVIVRMSDFKTNEYADLIGGRVFEPEEENPMLGWRGASRYGSEGYGEGFALECAAIRMVRDEMGLTNVAIMIPFCRTVDEADGVLATLADHGLLRGRNGLEVYIMAEIPANIELAGDFAERIDGFSIGSNDLTQLVLGVDRDSEPLAHLFDEWNPAVTGMIRRLIETGHGHGRKVGLCGQKPSDDPSYARFLVSAGIDSISISPDSFLAVKRYVAEAEAGVEREREPALT
ncbi:MAG: phosphoenolpyruvate synthase [Candidatus Limnocylindrales bacterium]